ncbi:MAG: hypothetical protein ACYTFQ_27860, partial [Planctomycetota bacterium]
MSEGENLDVTTDSAKRRFRRKAFILIGAVTAAIILCLVWKAGWWDFRSVDEKLAAIEAELAIPESENAAAGYMELFTNPANTGVLDDLYADTPSAYVEPWGDGEHPELAAGLEANQEIIQALLDISAMDKALFPIHVGAGTDSMAALSYVRKVTFILSWAAANDLGQGRIDAAFSKYRCQFRLARHLQRQPASYYRLVGVAIEGVASGNVRRAAMRDEVTAEQLDSLEAVIGIVGDQDKPDPEIAAEVDRLIAQKERLQLPLGRRFEQWWTSRRSLRRQQQRRELIGLRVEATRRASPILIAIRRYKIETGQWPETLEQIEPKLPEQMLIDPQNGGSFVYKIDGDSFVFYSKGPNGIDENGHHKSPAD